MPKKKKAAPDPQEELLKEIRDLLKSRRNALRAIAKRLSGEDSLFYIFCLNASRSRSPEYPSFIKSSKILSEPFLSFELTILPSNKTETCSPSTVIF